MNNVSVALSDADIKSIPELLKTAGKQHLVRDIAVGRPFIEQAKIVSEVQAAVLAIAPKTDPIDFDRGREPRDLLELRHGLCFDRSRVIEKILSYVGSRSTPRLDLFAEKRQELHRRAYHRAHPISRHHRSPDTERMDGRRS